MKPFLVLMLTLLHSSYCAAYENLELDLASGTAMNLTQFEGEGKTLLLWLPSERGFGQGYVPVALNLSTNDYDVWITHLHETYITPTGRHSLKEMEITDLVELISVAQQQGFEEVFLISSSRGMRLALTSAYLWQQQNPSSTFIKGLLSFTPHLVKGRTEMGQSAEYIDIAAYSNLPVYLLQPQHSTKFAHSWDIARQLQKGGSATYIHFISGVQGGFHMRPNEDLTELDIETREQLPELFDRAFNLLRSSRTSALTEGFNLENTVSDEADALKNVRMPGLHPYKGNKTPPALSLKDLDGQVFNLKASRDEVVLVNFWATWCGPCVEEIPSLSRLVERMKDRPFKVVAVNIGESADDIKQFLTSIPVNFDILLDSNGHAVRDWKVYAYPSNFLLDKNDQIQFSYRGALRWDSPEIIKTIENLF